MTTIKETHQREHGRMVFHPKTGDERITAFRWIVENQTFAKIDDCAVDLFTASLVVKVYDGLNEANRAKFMTMQAFAAGVLAYKLVK